MTIEKIVVGEGTDFPLNGLLTLPEDVNTPVPAVVLVHGSGASNMDEKVMKLTPFKDLAEGLVKYGIASLRYDKRTFAHGRKMAKMLATAKEETIDDAILAVDLLKKDPRIDHERIYVLGHSMGAMLAPRIDAEGADCKGLILLAGTPFRMEDIVVRQLGQAAGKGLLGKIVTWEQKVYGKKFEGLYDMPDEEAKKKKWAGGLTLYYFKEMGRKTADEYLLESEKPVLILQGGKDFQVLADEDYKVFQERLKDRPNTFFKLYPALNHVFVEGIYDDILKATKEYSVERHIGEEVIKDIASFILKGQL
ncbi:MAG: alpha/beta fold hydrolase [Erysipelotrichaceae bacterium]|nr:alpha/beta fold hydrolase [Erysipelotrichaceae bacterium]